MFLPQITSWCVKFKVSFGACCEPFLGVISGCCGELLGFQSVFKTNNSSSMVLFVQILTHFSLLFPVDGGVTNVFRVVFKTLSNSLINDGCLLLYLKPFLSAFVGRTAMVMKLLVFVLELFFIISKKNT